MRFATRIACLSLAAAGLMGPITIAGQQPVAAQTAAQKPGLPVTELEKQGEALFWRDCSLCHVDRTSPRFNHRGRNTLGIVALTSLVGLYRLPSITDEAVRRVIQEGIPGRMPAYKYTYELKPPVLDQLIAYLKVR